MDLAAVEQHNDSVVHAVEGFTPYFHQISKFNVRNFHRNYGPKPNKDN